jgi:hypothetical protein
VHKSYQRGNKSLWFYFIIFVAHLLIEFLEEGLFSGIMESAPLLAVEESTRRSFSAAVLTFQEFYMISELVQVYRPKLGSFNDYKCLLCGNTEFFCLTPGALFYDILFILLLFCCPQIPVISDSVSSKLFNVSSEPHFSDYLYIIGVLFFSLIS